MSAPKVPQKQKQRGRPWLRDGGCVRLRAERENHVWSYEFVSATTHDVRTLRLLKLIDEYAQVPGEGTELNELVLRVLLVGADPAVDGDSNIYSRVSTDFRLNKRSF